MVDCEIILGGKGRRVTQVAATPVGIKLEDGAEIGRIVPYENMNVTTELRVARCFDEPELVPRAVPVEQGLRNLVTYVKLKVIAPLEPFLI